MGAGLLRAGDPPGAVVLETEAFRWTVGPDGRNAALVERSTGRDLLDPEGPPFATIRHGGRVSAPSSASRSADRIRVTFRDPDATLEILVRERPRWVVLELASSSDPSVEGASFGAVRLALPGRTSGISGVAIGEELAAAARPLDLRTALEVQGGPRPILRPAASSRAGIVGARVAIAVCPTARLRLVLQEIVRSEGLPGSPLGGPFALEAEETRGSYVFATVSEANADAWIALARKAGLAQIHMISWERSLGHYEPRPDLFPGGLRGLESVVAKIHAAGLRVGMHTLTGGISRNDPFVTPVPDRRLARDGRFTLAADLTESGPAVPIEEPPGDLETSWQYSGRSNVVQIDDELVEYRSLTTGPPHALGGCARGAFGTRPAPHAKGSAVHHLFAIYGTFQPDESSTLVEDVAERIARVFNACRFDMIYQDGAEGMPGGPYGCARMREAIFRSLEGRVLVEASEWGCLSWPYHSRIGAYDHPNWGLKRFVDVHLRDAAEYRASSLLACQLGWWAILGPDQDHRAELPDEVEYLCTKALAHDMPLSFQGIDVGVTPWCARQDEYLEIIGRHERLRLARAVPEGTRARLRAEREEFHLEDDGAGGWRFVPTDYLEHRVTGTDDGSSAWTVTNRHGPQPLRLRIECLYSAAAIDSPQGVTLLAPDATGEVVAAGSAPGVSASWDSGALRAASSLASRDGAWAGFRKEFRPPVDISRCGALGVEVEGDARGEILNFQLTNPVQFWPAWAEHYVDVDFEGRRTVELHFRERDADRFVELAWPYGGTSAVFRAPLIRSQTSALTVWVNRIPPGAEARCRIGAVRALPVETVRWENPRIEVGDASLVLPVKLQSGHLLEVDSPGVARHMDERGATIGTVRSDGAWPALAPGENRFRFACEAPEGKRVRVRVTVVVRGEPIPGS